jgi:hypothetical protein
MIKKYCRECDHETWQNPLKKVGNAQQEYRCVECGHPKRWGKKNWLLREGGRLVAIAAG